MLRVLTKVVTATPSVPREAAAELIAIRPVREAVASLFTGTPDTTSVGELTSPDETDEGSGLITEADTTTDPDVTDPGDECAPPGHLCVTCGGVTVYPDVYLMWTEQYDDKSGEWLSGALRR